MISRRTIEQRSAIRFYVVQVCLNPKRHWKHLWRHFRGKFMKVHFKRLINEPTRQRFISDELQACHLTLNYLGSHNARLMLSKRPRWVDTGNQILFVAPTNALSGVLWWKFYDLKAALITFYWQSYLFRSDLNGRRDFASDLHSWRSTKLAVAVVLLMRIINNFSHHILRQKPFANLGDFLCLQRSFRMTCIFGRETFFHVVGSASRNRIFMLSCEIFNCTS